MSISEWARRFDLLFNSSNVILSSFAITATLSLYFSTAFSNALTSEICSTGISVSLYLSISFFVLSVNKLTSHNFSLVINSLATASIHSIKPAIVSFAK